MLFSCTHKANWEAICCKKQAMINKNNAAENKKQKHHEYCVGDTVLYERRLNKKRKHKRPYNGSFTIAKVHANGTLDLNQGDQVKQTCNICLTRPYRL